MKLHRDPEAPTLDAVADIGEIVVVEVQQRPDGKMLYIHASDRTVVRIGRIQNLVMPGDEAATSNRGSSELSKSG